MGSFISGLIPDTTSNFGWWPTVLCALAGPLGQVYLRAMYYNGSLDKWWWIIPGSMPPFFSFIINVCMKWGIISIAQGPGVQVLDYWVLLPILVKIFMGMILSIFDLESELLSSIIAIILQFAAIMIPNLVRMSNNCITDIFSLPWASWQKTVIDSYVELGTASIIPILFKVLPGVSTVSTVLGYIPFLGDHVNSILWSLGFVFVYCLTNMINQNDMTTYCKNPTDATTMIWISCIISTLCLIGNFATDFMP